MHLAVMVAVASIGRVHAMYWLWLDPRPCPRRSEWSGSFMLLSLCHECVLGLDPSVYRVVV